MLPHRRFGNRVLTMVLARLARRPITDGQSGYRALSARAAASAEIIHDYNYAQVLTLDLVRNGLPLRRGADLVLVPRARPLVRPPRPLPAQGRPRRRPRAPRPLAPPFSAR